MTPPQIFGGRRRRPVAAGVVLGGTLLALLGLGAPAAHAHPLNNFSINQYHGLELFPDHIFDHAVLDTAEIPTLQEKPSIDEDSDGVTSAGELAAAAARKCAALSRAVEGQVGATPLRWQILRSSFAYLPGEKGLSVSRLECDLSAPAPLGRTTTVRFATGYQPDHVGWREITAIGRGVRMTAASVPEKSTSDALLRYPNELLSSPLDQRSAVLSTTPGTGLSPGPAPEVGERGPVAEALAPLNRTFDGLLARDLTLGVGLLALALSMLLGASHAALPGHGKTVMAAYLVGRHGGVRDALLVGATVTATHTGGVLAMGLLLSATAAVSGEGLLAWLGLASGALITGIGFLLLRSSWRDRHRPRAGHGHDAPPVPALALAGTSTAGPRPEPEHGHGHGHGYGHRHGHALGVEPAEEPAHEYGPAPRQFTRRGLVGLGVAGGLVPSPSALVVLLGAIALGRTWFGVALVLGYGLGMAITLIAAGLLLVRLRDRAGDALAARPGDVPARVSVVVPILTAALVVVVGSGLMLNELPRIR